MTYRKTVGERKDIENDFMQMTLQMIFWSVKFRKALEDALRSSNIAIP
jgi:hypothetical protein